MWGLEVLNEAYSKKDTGVYSEDDSCAPQISQGIPRVHVRGHEYFTIHFVCVPINNTYHPSASTDQPAEVREFAVRVDKVMVLGLHGAREGRVLRGRTQAQEAFMGIHAANKYLKCDEIWGKLVQSTPSVISKKQDETRIEKKDHVKGLVPIEIKVA